MRGLLILLAVLAVCLCIVPPAEAQCAGGFCAAPGLVQGQPVRNVGRVAVAPVRAVVAIQPVRSAARGVAALKPVRRAGKAALLPVRLVKGICCR
jgi:hypothetical protein